MGEAGGRREAELLGFRARLSLPIGSQIVHLFPGVHITDVTARSYRKSAASALNGGRLHPLASMPWPLRRCAAVASCLLASSLPVTPSAE